ncbi:uncharacterized protein FSUBG_4833 [Fusarium subglutinans]|uniref:Uncharacterized protein n=1 Tax=Gibberella subglutinans TaxID=42677 RepID=A0A8H5V2A7_GIBSU|nr:uncharacterized protein FSUBG_4833 [Fusarium subglutinans]KAF5608297.1 hypothetical protein FSUBG_4833 [Fusarium subglutinans]
MPTFTPAEIAFSVVTRLGYWKVALEEIKDMYPPLRLNAPRRPPTYLPPLLPVRETMDDVYRLQSACQQSLLFLRDNAISAEDMLVLRVIHWLVRAERDETTRIQRTIWFLDPEHFRREIREGHWHIVNNEVVMGPDPRANAGADAGGNAGRN